MAEADIRGGFEGQARFCERMGAPITARAAAGLGRALSRDTAVGRRVLDWRGDCVADALTLRLLGGVHALHQQGREPALAPLFTGAETDDAAIAAILRHVLARHEEALLPWLDGPPQTNELARSGALMAGLLTVAAAVGGRFELLEIGSSAGLNLLIDRVRYDLGGVTAGPAEAPITVRPEWRGFRPLRAEVTFESVRGVDIQPIDVADPAQAARLRGYVWADTTERLDRMAAAIAMIGDRPVRLEQGDAADWVEARLAQRQAEGVTRVLVHSVVWQYLPPATQARITAAMESAGERASIARPLAWVMMEPDRDLARHDVRARWWPGGGQWRAVAVSHPHAAWVEGLG